MVRVFEKRAWLLAIALAFAIATTPARAADSGTSEICQPLDERTGAAAVDSYFSANLTEHGANSFARPVRDAARAQARAFLGQRIADKRAELCAARLKVAQDIKASVAQYATADCAGAAVVGLLDRYTTTSATAYDQNRQALSGLLDNHLKQIKVKLFEIAKGSNAGVDGAAGAALASAPKEARFDWVKQEASKLGAEANVVWGAAGSASNPLVQASMAIAREAVRAKQERDSAKVRFHTDGRLSASCKK
jgi:hypothetical protein